MDGVSLLRENIGIEVTYSIECEDCIDSSQEVFYISIVENISLGVPFWVNGPVWDGWKYYRRATLPGTTDSLPETVFTKEKYNGDGIYIFPENNSLGIAAGEPAYDCYKVVSRAPPLPSRGLIIEKTVVVRCSGYVEPVYYHQEMVPNTDLF
jgi:hypothetical protein